MNCRYFAQYFAITLLAALGLAACGGGSGAEAPTYVTNPEGARIATVGGDISMTTPRADAAAIRLRDGRVLICGGTSNGQVGGVLSSAELYDPVAHSFTPTGAMNDAREGQTITMLTDGRVLLIGGVKNVGFRAELASAEIYDPSTGTFSPTGSMTTPREGHTATLLRDGRVLVTGGSDNGTHTLDSAEIYDPAAGTFSRAGHLYQPRIAHTATRLLNGAVLIAGGGRGDRPGGYIAYDTAEIFDPATSRFTPLRVRMVNARVGAAAVLLQSGRALIVGGKSGQILTAGIAPNLASLTPLDTAEFYDPESGLFAATARMGAPHYLPTTTLLDNGQVLVVGGWVMQGPTIVGMRDGEVYDPAWNRFSRVGRTNVARLENTATLLDGGDVLIAGGIDGSSNITAAVELYSARAHRFATLPEAAALGISSSPTAAPAN
ncbi:MAG TPA: kelch repeat-containing protein [Candidatus Acidoferrales bacterium]|nr:kelch repeat-containing protein [Candidatus Acidoferrales bacterium]